MGKTFAWVLGIGLLGIVLWFILGMAGDAAQTVKKEYAPSALLKKYESFKDMSAAIDKKMADIQLYQEQIAEETDKVEKNQLKAEMRGIIAIHNQLCADYNAQMSKFNYRFTNKGDLPATNLEPLPREIKPYITSMK
jgi:hypothetical protein